MGLKRPSGSKPWRRNYSCKLSMMKSERPCPGIGSVGWGVMESDSSLNLFVEVTICNKRALTTYKETHVPIARLSHVGLALAIATRHGLEVQQINVRSSVRLWRDTHDLPTGLPRRLTKGIAILCV